MKKTPEAEHASLDESAEAGLDLALQSLPEDIAPPSDLWARIEPRLGARTSSEPGTDAGASGRQRWGWGIAAAIGAIWFAAMSIPEREPAFDPAREYAQGADDAAFAEQSMMQTYEQQKAMQLASMDSIPVSYGNWQQQLAIWDGAVAQVSLALHYYPEDPQLLRQLDQLYRQQLDYLRRLNAVAEITEVHDYL